MASTTDYRALATRKDWVLAAPKKIPEQRAPGLYDHIEGLPEDLTSVVKRTRFRLMTSSTIVFNAELTFQGKTHDVVIRVTPPHDGVPEDVEPKMQEIARELKIWRLLRHPNILQLHGLFFDPVFHVNKGVQLPTLILPLCENDDVARFLKEHPEMPRLPFLVDVAHGLEHLHKYDIIHADMKPSNIFVRGSSPNFRAVISDFGCSKILGELETFGYSFGKTYRYCAPEHARERGWIATKESDVCSLSLTMLTMVSGKEPLADLEDTDATTAMHGGGRPQCQDHPCLEMSDSLWTLLEACWQAAPESRPGMEYVVAQLVAISTQRTL
ncbi:kinase-like protein [Pleurotus eryngii]|uniref:Kinase-like protein n=1 Tax=Pleurotus eryngii TaxID=5323 RepID=A0A9P5ZXE6_PLEER|nr:kinase-like protein [Pleurotus eryngii]